VYRIIQGDLQLKCFTRRRAQLLSEANRISRLPSHSLINNLTICNKSGYYYGRPLSVSGRPCYILPMFIYFLWPPYSPALVNGGSRKFYTWWTLSVIEEVTTWIFSWSSLNYRVGQKVTKFRIFSDPARKLSALTPERGRIL